MILWLAQDRVTRSFSNFNDGWNTGGDLILWLCVFVVLVAAAIAAWYFLLYVSKQKDYRDNHRMFFDMAQKLGLSNTERSLIVHLAEQQKVKNVVEYYVRVSLWNEWINRNAQTVLGPPAERLREKLFGKI